MATDEFGEILPKMNIPLCEEAYRWAAESKRLEDEYIEKLPGGRFLSVLDNVRIPAPDGYNLKWGQYSYRSNIQVENINQCGSYACICGFALEQTGNVEPGVDPTYGLVATPKSEIVGYNETKDIGYQDWTEAGALVLGLSNYEAACLFAGDNSLSTIKAYLESFAEARGEHIELGD